MCVCVCVQVYRTMRYRKDSEGVSPVSLTLSLMI